MVVCIGKERLANKKLGIRFRMYEGGVLGEELLYGLDRSTRSYSAGHIYEISYDPQTHRASFPRVHDYKGQYPDAEQRAAWQTKSRAEEAAARDLKEVDELEMARLLRPLRVAYQSTDAMGRCAIEARLLYYLRYGKPGEE